MIAGIVLLLAAIVAWPFLFFGLQSPFLTIGPWGGLPLVAFLIAVAILAGWPPTRAGVWKLLETIRPMPARRRAVCSVAAGVVAAVYLVITSLAQHRPRYPYFHDECSYLIQAHQFAAGRLWEPAHSLADFFESFQLFAEPKYASAYFPGTALLYVPGVWLHVPPWVTSIAIAAVVAGLLFRITAELFDGVGAALAMLLLMADTTYRQCATLALAQMPCLMYGLLALLAWLRWRQKKSFRRSIPIGIALGLAAVTRPVDALIFGLPIGFALLASGSIKARLRTCAAVAIGVSPLLGLQVTINHGITGDWLTTPFRLYADRDYPGTAYGFHRYDHDARPVSKLPQKQALYDQYVPTISSHRWADAVEQQFRPFGTFSPARFQLTIIQDSTCGYPLLVVLIPLSLLAMTRPRAVVTAAAPLFLLLYVPYVFFFAHYTLTAAAAVIAAILAGARGAEHLLPGRPRVVAVTATLLIAGLSFAAFPQFDESVTDIVFDSQSLAQINAAVAKLPADRPAVVLFKYDPRDPIGEPVYNTDAAWPDDARVVRAHDLGFRNIEIFRYYAARQPDRMFYRYVPAYDEGNREWLPGALVPIGKASDLR